MKIVFLNMGKTTEAFLHEGILHFEKRVRHYCPFEIRYLIPPKQTKNLPETLQKEEEGRLILTAIEGTDFPVLLDERGKQMNSPAFAAFLQQAMNRGTRTLAFITGGPYGFSEAVYGAVHERLSLSAMTFSHQIVRLAFMEQLYRGFTIIRGEPYHHG